MLLSAQTEGTGALLVLQKPQWDTVRADVPECEAPEPEIWFVKRNKLKTQVFVDTTASAHKLLCVQVSFGS